MWRDGIRVTRVSSLGFRFSDPSRDKDLDGEPLKAHHVAIVKIKNCRIYEEDGRKYYDATNAPGILYDPCGSNKGYGKERKNNGSRIFKDPDGRNMRMVSPYYTIPYYHVEDGVVYRGMIYNEESEEVRKGN